ncbi:hypothetical protein [Nocardia sp. NPDC051981]|uniref:hypothetical protein n=1 Tax=Nocardia sp. NPDC051981 TaxID=3155417 RepID=UPI00343EB1A9
MVGSGNAELSGDLADGVAALTVFVEFGVHLPCQRHRPWSEFGSLAAGASAGTGGGKPVAGAFGHQSVLEFGYRPLRRDGRVPPVQPQLG